MEKKLQTHPLGEPVRPTVSAVSMPRSANPTARSWWGLLSAEARRRNETCQGVVQRTFMALLVLVLASSGAQAQELEPRLYSSAPVGLNFLVTAYGYSEGGLSTDPSLPIRDAQLNIHTGALGFGRTLDLWGKSGRFDVILPYSYLSGTALVAGEPKEREVNGFGDPRFRLSVNLYGAPALSIPAFAGFKQDLVIGASIQVSAPSGQYDPSRLVNLGTNRWSVKPDLGFSKSFGAFTLDLTTGATFYSDNHDYSGGKTLEQEPLYSTQTNFAYNFGRGAWVSFGATYYSGGRTTVNGVRNEDALSNSRAGMTLALPVDRRHSIKFNASGGVSTRTGSNFKTVGIAWQYRWGAGL